MGNVINRSDLSLITQQKQLNVSIKLEIYNDNNTLLSVVQSNIIEGTFSIDSESDVRRTCSISLKPDKKKSIFVNQDGYIWVNKSAKIYIGVENTRTKQYVWYSQGLYYFKDTSATYDATTNTLNVSACDYMISLDGTKDGNVDALQISIPAYEVDENTGEITKRNIIRDAMVSTITQLGKVKDYMIDDIGEQNAMEQINSDWKEYRKKHELWNTIPYDLEFSSGTTVLSMVSQLRDLYPNYETFFDSDGIFVCQMIPNCDNDDIVFDDDFFQKILISENCNLDLSSVRNVCKVWGKVIEADMYCDSSVYKDNIYTCNVDGYSKYKTNDKIAVRILNTNNANPMLQINNLSALPIYSESTDTYINANLLSANKVYSFKISRLIVDNEYMYVAYWLGEWQPCAITALIDGKSNEDYITKDGKTVKKYSLEYFKDKYNCNTASVITIPNSPFTVEKIGEVLNPKSGDEYDNIMSDSLALERAEYENWKTTRLKDTISIDTKIVPFADVNIKCQYRRSDLTIPYSYVVKSITHNFNNGTTSWTMYRHYPSMKTILENLGTHNALSSYPHSILELYTHEELEKFWEGAVY